MTIETFRSKMRAPNEMRFSMKECIKCQNPLPIKEKVCPNCGPGENETGRKNPLAPSHGLVRKQWFQRMFLYLKIQNNQIIRISQWHFHPEMSRLNGYFIYRDDQLSML